MGFFKNIFGMSLYPLKGFLKDNVSFTEDILVTIWSETEVSVEIQPYLIPDRLQLLCKSHKWGDKRHNMKVRQLCRFESGWRKTKNCNNDKGNFIQSLTRYCQENDKSLSTVERLIWCQCCFSCLILHLLSINVTAYRLIIS